MTQKPTRLPRLLLDERSGTRFVRSDIPDLRRITYHWERSQMDVDEEVSPFFPAVKLVCSKFRSWIARKSNFAVIGELWL